MDTASTTVNLVPFLDTWIFPILSTVLLALAGVLATWLARKFAALLHLQSDDVVRQYLERALDAAAQLGLNKAMAEGQKLGAVDLHNAAAAHGAQYVIDNVPDALNRLGITPDQVEDMIRARLPTPQPAPTPAPAA